MQLVQRVRAYSAKGHSGRADLARPARTRPTPIAAVPAWVGRERSKRAHPGDARPSWSGLHLTQRAVRFECSLLALVYVGVWLLGLAYVLALVWR
jgi:hypothetical protein